MPGTIPAAGTWQKITDTAILPLGWHKEQKRSERMRERERETSGSRVPRRDRRDTKRHGVAADLPLTPSAPPGRPGVPSPHPTLIATCPSTLSISAKSAESRDDFPQPTWPTTATREPSGMEKVMLK